MVGYSGRFRFVLGSGRRGLVSGIYLFGVGIRRIFRGRWELWRVRSRGDGTIVSAVVEWMGCI